MSDPMSERELGEIRARAEKATKGPWDSQSWGPYPETVALYSDHAEPKIIGEFRRCARAVIGYGSAPGRDQVTAGEHNAEFVAHARTDIPALLAEIDRLRELMKEARMNMEIKARLMSDHGLGSCCQRYRPSGFTAHSPDCLVTRLRTAGEG